MLWRSRLYFGVATAALLAPRPARAQDTETEQARLERAGESADDPAASILSVSALNLTSYLIGPHQRTANVLILQGVLPIPAGPRLSLNAMARVPFAWLPDPSSATNVNAGMGDAEVSMFLGPKLNRHFQIGIGPIARIPSATNPELGSRDSAMLSIGPTAAVIATAGRFILGALVSNVWSVASTRSNAIPVNGLLLQPLFTLQLPQAWYLTSAPIINADWTRPPGQQWLVPLGGGFGHVNMITRTIGLRLELQAFWNAVRPDAGPAWSLSVRAAVFSVGGR